MYSDHNIDAETFCRLFRQVQSEGDEMAYSSYEVYKWRDGALDLSSKILIK